MSSYPSAFHKLKTSDSSHSLKRQREKSRFWKESKAKSSVTVRCATVNPPLWGSSRVSSLTPVAMVFQPAVQTEHCFCLFMRVYVACYPLTDVLARPLEPYSLGFVPKISFYLSAAWVLYVTCWHKRLVVRPSSIYDLPTLRSSVKQLDKTTWC